MEFEWEEIWKDYKPDESNFGEATFRAIVPGGWIVKNRYFTRHGVREISLIFISDPEHFWGEIECQCL